LPARGGEREDVPDLGWDDVGGDEVDHALAVGDSVGIDVALVGSVAVEAASGFDLDAEEAGAGAFALCHRKTVVEHCSTRRARAPVATQFVVGIYGPLFVSYNDGDVIRGAVSPGTEDGESEFGGAGHEEKLDPLALEFVVGESVFGH